METPFSSIVWRGAAILCAVAIAVLTLLPKAVPPAHEGTSLDRTTGAAAVGLLLLALAATTLLRARSTRRPGAAARRARPLWPIALALLLCGAGLGLIASAGLAADAVRAAAPDGLTGLRDLAASRLSASHVLAYGVLGFLLALGWGDGTRPLRRLGLLGLLVVALGGVLEVLQDLIPGRNPSKWDMLSNGIGLAIGLVTGQLLPRRAPQD